MPEVRYVSPSNGRLSRVAKVVISSIYAITPLALLVYRSSRGESVDSVILIIIVMFMFASAYVIFGESIVDKATDKATDITSEEEEGSE